MTNPSPPVKKNPVFLDAALAPLQVALSSLSWLQTIYGPSQRFPLDTTYRRYAPAVYVGSSDNSVSERDYLKLFPDDHLKNFAFFDVNGQTKFDSRIGFESRITFTAGLIIWFDFRSVFPDDHVEQSLENVKQIIVTKLKSARGNFKVLSISDDVSDIYRGYDYGSLNTIFLSRPYGGFRVELEFNFDTGTIC